MLHEESGCCQNTDRELWRDQSPFIQGRDYYADSIHVTQSGGIGINCGGHVIVAPLRSWWEAGELYLCVDPALPRWRQKLSKWLLNKPTKPRIPKI